MSTQVPYLPPTIPGTEERIHWYLPWPGHSHLDVWLVDGGEFALDAVQVMDRIGVVAPDTFDQFPPTWFYRWSPPPTRMQTEVYLWSRPVALQAAAALCPDFDLEHAFQAWLMAHWTEATRGWADYVEESTPKRRTADGEEFPVLQAARRLANRYGGRVSQQFVFAQMLHLGWVERDDKAHEHGRYRTTPAGRARGLVFSRTVALPAGKGTYEQVFITEVGMADLSTHVRGVVQGGLFEYEGTAS